MSDQVNKKNSIFREKSLERIENPEKLNDYLRVTSPGVWLVLAAVIVILAGVCVWGVFGRIHSTASAAVVTSNGESICLVPSGSIEGVTQNHIVTVGNKTHELVIDTLQPETITESTDVYVMLAGGLSFGDVVFPVKLQEPLADDGVATGTLITESISPLSLFFSN